MGIHWVIWPTMRGMMSRTPRVLNGESGAIEQLARKCHIFVTSKGVNRLTQARVVWPVFLTISALLYTHLSGFS